MTSRVKPLMVVVGSTIIPNRVFMRILTSTSTPTLGSIKWVLVLQYEGHLLSSCFKKGKSNLHRETYGAAPSLLSKTRC